MEGESFNLSHLIAQIQLYPYLYDTTDKRYKDAKLKNRTWREIARTLHSTALICQKSWKSLRDRFVKKRKAIASGSDAGSNWEYYQEMLFYESYSKPRITYGNIWKEQTDSISSSDVSGWSSIDVVSPTGLSEDEKYAIPDSIREDSPGSGREDTPRSAIEETQKRKRKQSDETSDLIDMTKQIYEKLVERLEPNANSKFAEFVALRLNQMPEEEAKEKRKQIMMIIEN
ncbi:uncharacterized protein LOC109606174 [Aethina tumida]|uniref:uncharacterized protein LOC109606174 n=1 Tax=Aethina tumida TaxID=116153 RepID=UPI00096ADB22|nr:uncharacterized protein LOC109606174 [Aethina tumida]